MVDAEAPVKTCPKRAAASLKTPDATLFLSALDAMESGKRPQAEAALHAIRVFIDGVMTLACDSAVVGSEEDAADARAAVVAAEAAMKAEAEAKAAAEKARKEGKNRLPMREPLVRTLICRRCLRRKKRRRRRRKRKS